MYLSPEHATSCFLASLFFFVFCFRIRNKEDVCISMKTQQTRRSVFSPISEVTPCEWPPWLSGQLVGQHRFKHAWACSHYNVNQQHFTCQ